MCRYTDDSEELAIDDTDGSKLFVFPKLPVVALQGLNCAVPMGDRVLADKLSELGAEHSHEFKLNNIRRPGQNNGQAPRDIVLILYVRAHTD